MKLAAGSRQYFIIPLGISGAEIQVRNGEKQPVQGWVSNHYGEIEPTPVIGFSGQSFLPVRIAVAMYLGYSPHLIGLPDLAAQILELVEDMEREVE